MATDGVSFSPMFCHCGFIATVDIVDNVADKEVIRKE
jgi:hypothetical protein